MRLATVTLLLAAGLAPASHAAADWLVIASNSDRFGLYQLLPARGEIALATGETLQLLDDGGTQVTVEGPRSVDLAGLRDGGTSGTTGLAGRLASLLGSEDRIERPGTSRAVAAESGDALPDDAIDINASTARCVDAGEPLLLGRSASQQMSTADVEVRAGGGTVLKRAWPAGFATLALELGDVADAPGVRVTVRQGLAGVRNLDIGLLPGDLPLHQKLERMLAAGCRSDLERTLHRIADRGR